MSRVIPSEPAPGETRARPGCAGEPTGLKFYLTRGLPVDVFWCLVIALFLTLVMGSFLRRGWLSLLLLNSIISLSIGLSVANAFRLLLPRLRRRFPGKLANVASHVVIAVLGTALGVELAVRVIEAIGSMHANDLRRDAFRIGLVIIATVLAIDLTYDRLRRQARRDELRAQEARREALRAELKALQARTNPHFLFNSLNTAAGLIEEDPAAAEQVIERLAALFRYALRGSEVGWVRLGEEIEAVRGYLEVESIRLGERLESEIWVAPEAAEVLVPPLVLQPLVENAVLHGIAPRKGGGRVRVAAARAASALVLSVSDDGDGPGSSRHQGSGTSLAELERRLEMLYGGDAGFASGTGANGGFEVTLSLPLEHPA
jgi:sensor histidine kinase YesM